MSRSGYSDDCWGWDLVRWRGAVKSAIRGKRGQAFLRELADVLDAMPQKRLIRGDLIRADGEVCAIGAVCVARGIDTTGVDSDDPEAVASLVGIAWAMAAEIEFENDQDFLWRPDETPEQRWTRMRRWVAKAVER